MRQWQESAAAKRENASVSGGCRSWSAAWLMLCGTRPSRRRAEAQRTEERRRSLPSAVRSGVTCPSRFGDERRTRVEPRDGRSCPERSRHPGPAKSRAPPAGPRRTGTRGRPVSPPSATRPAIPVAETAASRRAALARRAPSRQPSLPTPRVARTSGGTPSSASLTSFAWRRSHGKTLKTGYRVGAIPARQCRTPTATRVRPRSGRSRATSSISVSSVA
jgi:hypothetical protein